MATKQQNVTVTKDELDHANATWTAFMQFTKYGIIGTVVILALMAVFLL